MSAALHKGESGMKMFFIKAALFAAALTMMAPTAEAGGCSNTNSGNDAQVEKIPAELEYRRNNEGGVTITAYIGDAVTLIIPAAIEGLPVTSIERMAFSGRTDITSVTIPSSVTSIGNNAFSGCTGLTSVTLPDSVITIGNYAFRECESLTTVTIPSSVTSIGLNAFKECTGLASVTIPNSVTTIGSGAFTGCRGLTSVTIPSSVTKIERLAFDECTSLTSVTFAEGSNISFSDVYTVPPPFPGDLRGKY